MTSPSRQTENPGQPFGSSSLASELESILDRCASMVTQLSKLPFVPTIDWCDRVAAVLVSVESPADGQAADQHDLAARGDLAARDGLAGQRQPKSNAPSSGSFAGVAFLSIDANGKVLSVRAQGTSARPASVHVRDAAERARADSARCALSSLPGRRWLPASVAPPATFPAAGSLERVLVQDHPICDLLSPECRSITWAAAEVAPRSVLVGYLTSRHVHLSQHTRSLLLTCINVSAKLAGQALQQDASGEISWLTPREQEVLERLIEGKSVREISDEMSRSPHTVHDYVKSLHKKLGAGSRGELVARVLGHVPGKEGAPATPGSSGVSTKTD